MAEPLATGGWAVALKELHSFFEACGDDVDEALAAHFGFDTANDRITAGLELATEHIQSSPAN
ncbi:hypothetical protein PV733_45685 [Streptomyces europaeiscabiei]|uniref:hypothetical protein n=1 Tax=Streptomyces europaeiscabiei TaxID=146819 RepID=UPI0029B0035E|nr:hypothetical protein [Streptomyces europaeiscabiei]MDX3716060.1 hypothetical protein [Streptomyces europaeiscabiei]